MNPFRVPKHQKYRYIPRYWEPEKEDLQARVREASQQTSDNPDDMKSRISRGFQRRAYVRGNIHSNSTKRSNLILIALVIGLFWLSYVLLTRYLPAIIDLLE